MRRYPARLQVTKSVAWRGSGDEIAYAYGSLCPSDQLGPADWRGCGPVLLPALWATGLLPATALSDGAGRHSAAARRYSGGEPGTAGCAGALSLSAGRARTPAPVRRLHVRDRAPSAASARRSRAG